MKEKETIFGAVSRIFEEKRKRNRDLTEKRIEELNEKIPGFAENSEELRKTGLELGLIAIRQGKASEAYLAFEKKLEFLGEEQKKMLKAYNYTVDYADDVSCCKLCGDSGKTEKGYCECFMKEYNAMLLEESGLPVKQGLEAFDIEVFNEKERPEAEKRLQKAKNFVKDFKTCKNLAYLGPCGVGKTYLASCIGTEITKTGRQVVYVTVSSLMQGLIYYGDDELLVSRRDTMMKIVYDADLLILDELGTEMLGNARQDLINNIIDRRVSEEKKKTIICSNLSPKEIMERYGERLFSRLALFDIVRINDVSDIRMKRRG